MKGQRSDRIDKHRSSMCERSACCCIRWTRRPSRGRVRSYMKKDNTHHSAKWKWETVHLRAKVDDVLVLIPCWNCIRQVPSSQLLLRSESYFPANFRSCRFDILLLLSFVLTACVILSWGSDAAECDICARLNGKENLGAAPQAERETVYSLPVPCCKSSQ